jgi:uncharacterized membrane protein YagU involved in acid resistance
MNRLSTKAILFGGIIGGTFDIIFAISWAAYNGMAPTRLLQVVASGLLGKAAFDGGLPVAALGLLLHFAMALLIAAIFVLISRRVPPLLKHPLPVGALFGIAVFLTMRLVVLPLSAFPYPVTLKSLGAALDLLSHMFLFGVPIALAAAKAQITRRPA